MKFFYKTLVILFCSVFFSCGLMEVYHLRQVPEGDISTDITTAIIDLPSIGQDYPTNYRIYYRIYISGWDSPGADPITTPSSISQAIANDFSYIEPYTDPTEDNAVTSGFFSSRKYFALELEAENNDELWESFAKGGILRFSFLNVIGEKPYAVFTDNNGNDGNPIPLRRSSGNENSINNIEPKDPEEFFAAFFNTADLNDKIDSETNIDVAGAGAGRQNAYVSMYIVAEGHPDFSTIVYSKPTHINIFKLPNAN